MATGDPLDHEPRSCGGCAGGCAGNLGGAALFQTSLHLPPADTPPLLLVRGGALPLSLAAAPFALNILSLASCARADPLGDADSKKRRDEDADDLM